MHTGHGNQPITPSECKYTSILTKVPVCYGRSFTHTTVRVRTLHSKKNDELYRIKYIPIE